MINVREKHEKMRTGNVGDENQAVLLIIGGLIVHKRFEKVFGRFEKVSGRFEKILGELVKWLSRERAFQAEQPTGANS